MQHNIFTQRKTALREKVAVTYFDLHLQIGSLCEKK